MLSLRYFGKSILVILFFISIANMALSQDLQPFIEVQPGLEVEVGEEVYFSATSTTYPDAAILAKARYEWDFGDGYYHRFDPVDNTITRSGIAVIHYYMKPGDFNVNLKVSVWQEWDAAGSPIGDPLATETTTKIVRVRGEEPLKGFEIQRAPFHNRLAQYLYVQIPENYRKSKTQLRVTLEGSKGSSNILLSKNNLSAEEIAFLDHKPLLQDNYVVIAELLDANGQRIKGGLWRDKFSKQYSGIPKVGIDENNAFRVNGELFFPVNAFMTDIPKIDSLVADASINGLHTVGYYKEHSPTAWNEYLDIANSYSLMAIGPGRGDYRVSSEYWSPAIVNRWEFNHNPDRMADYVRLNKDKSSMFAWIWQDEPNLGGRNQKIYPATLAAWCYVAHREDPHHPAFNLFAGGDWTPYKGEKLTTYDYLESGAQFGGKKHMQDVFEFDLYPIAFRLHSFFNYVDKGPYSAYLLAIDKIHSNNKNLVPVIPTINPSNRKADGFMHTEEQVYLEAWMNVIHGVKGLLWFPYFDAPSIRWKAMKKFGDQMKVLASAVLQPAPTRSVTDSANDPLNRVDTLIREYNGFVYIFAARITEPEPIEEALYRGVEPDIIKVDFIVSEISGNAIAEVVDENRKVSLSDGQFTDTFTKNAVHIYKISNKYQAPQNLRAIPPVSG